MWPDKYDMTRKNNRQQLHNDIIKCLQEKDLGWSKENVLGIDPSSCAKSDLDRLPFLKQFLNHCCQTSHYSFLHSEVWL